MLNRLIYHISQKVLEVSGESFIQPCFRPPFARDQITEPEMGNFMGQDCCDLLLVSGISFVWMIHQIGFPGIQF